MDFLDEINNRPASDIAHVSRDKKMTYGELKSSSDALSVYLIDYYKKDISPIVVIGDKDSLMLTCFQATVKAGHSYIPVDASMTETRIENIISNSGAKAVIKTCDKCIGEFAGKIIERTELENIIREYNGKTPDISYRVKDEDIFYIIYTSGSTGNPKGVQITKSNLQSFIDWGTSLVSKGKKTFMNQAPFSFDLSVMDTYLSLATGSTLYSIDKKMIGNLPDLFDNFKESGITTWVSTPSFAAMCIQSKLFDDKLLPNLQQMLFCGEVLAKDTTAKLFERFPGLKIINFYGPTEATVATTAVEITKEMLDEDGTLPVGYSKENSEIRIDEESGEILIIGDNVAKGYLNNEVETNKRFFTETLNGKPVRGYRTGDKGYLKENLLYYNGRLDFQIKLNGYRIELEDIECNMRKLDCIENAVIVPIVNNEKLQYLAAAVSLQDNNEIGVFEIKEKLREHLPEYMIPRKIKIVDKIPMNLNGKADRKSIGSVF